MTEDNYCDKCDGGIATIKVTTDFWLCESCARNLARSLEKQLYKLSYKRLTEQKPGEINPCSEISLPGKQLEQQMKWNLNNFKQEKKDESASS